MKRRAVTEPFLPTVTQMMRDAREAMAADLFGLDAVRSAIVQAAGLGRERLFLRPRTPLDLRRTAAAAALLDHLAAIGATALWHAYTVDQGGHPEEGYELEVGWRQSALTGTSAPMSANADV